MGISQEEEIEYMESFLDKYYTICPACGRQAMRKGYCEICGWKEIKTKEDLNKIQVHNQP